MDRDASDFRRDLNRLDDSPSLNNAVETLRDTRQLCGEAIDRIEELEDELRKANEKLEELQNKEDE